jgi:hypothetical protein
MVHVTPNTLVSTASCDTYSVDPEPMSEPAPAAKIGAARTLATVLGTVGCIGVQQKVLGEHWHPL